MGKLEPEPPINFMVKTPWVSGEDFPKKTNPLIQRLPNQVGTAATASRWPPTSRKRIRASWPSWGRCLGSAGDSGDVYPMGELQCPFLMGQWWKPWETIEKWWFNGV